MADNDEQAAKRRRLRKGTRSCWECKRRKVRCTFASESDAICITCCRRGSRCVGQELPEELGPTPKADGAERLMRVEALLDRLVNSPQQSVEKVWHQDQRATSGIRCEPSGYEANGIFTPPDTLPDSPGSREENVPHLLVPELHAPRPASQTANTPTCDERREKLSHVLLAAYPSHRDILDILDSSKGVPLLCHQSSIMSRRQRDEQDAQDKARLFEIPSEKTHPVLIAKQMLTLSSLLTYFPSWEEERRLSEDPHVIKERLADVAVKNVTTCEELLGTIEALECIVLEGVYHTNCGNIRRAWLTFRRAMGVAQMMGLHRLVESSIQTIIPNIVVDPRFLWNQILYMDRFLSMMLALPQGSPDGPIDYDYDIATEELGNLMPSLHTTIMGRILERNQLGRTPRALAMTKDIDTQLLKRVASMPRCLWQPPNFANQKEHSMDRFLENMRIKDQMLHYTLLNQLHLPYLFCAQGETNNSDYARITCVTACREVLSRFIAYRMYSPAAASRTADFLALVAGMTLVFVHLHSYCDEKKDNLLAHQRLGDRGVVEQALEKMEVVSKQEMLAGKSARLLQHLLFIEEDAAQGHTYKADCVHMPDESHEDHHNALLVNIPYVGTLRIAREGASSMVTTQRTLHHKQEFGAPITIGGIGTLRVAKSILTRGTKLTLQSDSLSRNHQNNGTHAAEPPPLQPPADLDLLDDLPSSSMQDDFFQHQELHPGLAASVDDWTFQGVDMAFFENLMQGSNLPFEDGGDMGNLGPSWHSDPGGL